MHSDELDIRRTELLAEELPPRLEVAEGHEKTDLIGRRAQIMESLL